MRSYRRRRLESAGAQVNNRRSGVERRAQLDWMPVIVDDFDTDETVMLMTMTEEGIYNRLMRRQWKEGSLPSDIESLAKLCKNMPIGKFKKAWKRVGKCFKVSQLDQSRVANPKLASLRSAAQVKSGLASKAAQIRWSPDANALQPQSEGSAPVEQPQCDLRSEIEIKISEESQSMSNESKTPRFDCGSLYDQYPRHEGKSPGMKTLKARIKSQSDYDSFAGAVRNYAAKVKAEGRPLDKVLLWSTFCNGRWQDYVDGAPAVEPVARGDPRVVNGQRQYENFAAPRPAVKETREVKL